MTSVLAPAFGLLVLSGILSGQSAAQSEPTVVDVAPFRSVALRHGGKAILRHGPTQRVTFLTGSPDCTKVTIASGDELVIDKHRSNDTRRCELEIDIVTPALARLSVAEGGTIQSRGTFPRQTEIGVTVTNGGTIDIRSMSVGSVTASVVSGGRILVKPLRMMVASVAEGGNITHWGDAPVTSSIQHGGVVTTGAPSDADLPLSESSPVTAPAAPIAPVPSIKERRHRRP
jgi:hypothetical protein